MQSFAQLTSYGAFTKGSAQIINNNFAQLAPGGLVPDVWVRPQAGNNNGNGSVVNPHGSYDNPFATMAGLARVIRPGIVIGLEGVLKENYIAPPCNDVSIIGFANQPRQATSGGAPNGGGATWMNPGTVAQALVEVAHDAATAQGSQSWRFQNIFFGQAGAAACMILNRPSGDGDASHAQVIGCTFTAPGINGGIGISCGEIIRLIVEGCQFYDFNGTTARAIYANIAGGIANPPYLQWVIRRNVFTNNVNHIVGALRNAVIEENDLFLIGRSQTTTGMILLAGGAYNMVMLNRFTDVSGAPSVGTYTGGTSDAWANYYSDGFVAGVPS